MHLLRVFAILLTITVLFSLVPQAPRWVVVPGVAASTCCNQPPPGPAETATLTYRGTNVIGFGSLGPVGPGGTLVTMTIPAPPSVNGDPNAWRFNFADGMLVGLRFSNDNFATNSFRPTFAQLTSTLVLTKAHLIEADSLDGNPLGTPGTGQTMGPYDYYYFYTNEDAVIGDAVTVSVSPSSPYSAKADGASFGPQYRLLPQDQSLVQITTPVDPTVRIISMQLGMGTSNSPAFTTLDPNFGTASAFFNTRFGVVVQWDSGRAIPTSLQAPKSDMSAGGQELLTDSFRTAPTDGGAFGRFYRFFDESAMIFISDNNVRSGAYGFNKLGVQINGAWTLTLKILDPNTLGSNNNQYTPIGPAGELTGSLYGEYEVVTSTQYTLTSGASLSFSAPDLTSYGWYMDGYSTVHITSQTCPTTTSCDANILTTDGLTAGGGVTGGNLPSSIDGLDNFLILYKPTVTITNPNTNPSTETFTVTYTVEYVADITIKLPSISDTSTVYDSTHNLHTVSIPLGSMQPDSSLGFNSDGTIEIALPGFNWQTYSDIKIPNGNSADLPTQFAWLREGLNDPNRFGLVGASTIYHAKVADFNPWAAYGTSAAGTWTYEALGPTTTLQYTKTGGDLLVTDPLGNKEGSDTVKVYSEIPGATYSGPESVTHMPEVVTIPNPIPGSFLVQITGVTTGTYQLTTDVIEAGTTVQEQIQSGPISPGQVVFAATVNDPTSQSPFTTSPLTQYRSCPEAKAGANLARANLALCNLAGINLSGANLQRATLTGANLQGANLRGANLMRANLQGAMLQGASL